MANFLLEVDKYAASRIVVDFPKFGEVLTIDCHSADHRYSFQADINRRNKINERKISYQLRSNKTVVLRRLCLNNGMHQNPPGPAPIALLIPYENAYIETNHVHLYMEGYGDRWAIPLSAFTELDLESDDNLIDVMVKFFVHCNIVEYSVAPHVFAQCRPL